MSRRALAGVLVTVVVFVGALSGSAPVLAYNNVDPQCAWSSGQISVPYTWGPNLQNPTYTWRQTFTTSVSDWNAAVTKPQYYESSTSVNQFDSYTAQDGLYGYAAVSCFVNPYQMASFTAKANSEYGPSYNWDASFMRSVTGHEMGHGLGLWHSTVSPSIMNSSRNRYVTFNPQTDDINGIGSMYP